MASLEELEETKAKLTKVPAARAARPRAGGRRCATGGGRREQPPPPAPQPTAHLPSALCPPQAVAKGKRQYDELKEVKQREGELQARVQELSRLLEAAGGGGGAVNGEPAANGAPPAPAASQAELEELRAKLDKVGSVGSGMAGAGGGRVNGGPPLGYRWPSCAQAPACPSLPTPQQHRPHNRRWPRARSSSRSSRA